MSFYSGFGEMDRKAQQGQQKQNRLHRVDQFSQSHQQMTKGMSHGDRRTQTSFPHNQTQNQGYHSQPYDSSRAVAEPRGSSHGNRTASGGYSKNQRILFEVRELLQNNRQLLYSLPANQKTVKEFDASFAELMHMASDQDPSRDVGQKRLEVELQKANETIEELSRELMSHKLSATMNTQLSVDETAIENVSIKNRPLNIATDYTNLCSSEWHAAKESLDSVVSGQHQEEARLLFLSKIMETAEEEAKKLKNKLFKDLDIILAQPVTWTVKRDVSHSTSGVEVSPALKNVLSDHLRVSSEKIDITELCQLITISTETSYGGEYNFINFLREKVAKDYIEGCASLAWKMVIQRPPMTFDARDGVKKRFDSTRQELHWGASDPDKYGAVVKFYVHPALKHGEKIMVKGRVWTK